MRTVAWTGLAVLASLAGLAAFGSSDRAGADVVAAAFAATSAIAWLAAIRGAGPHLEDLNRGEVRRADPGQRRALVLHYSLTGNARSAVDAVAEGLVARGYEVRSHAVSVLEPLFAAGPGRPVFPDPAGFVRTVVRAALRVPVRIAPLDPDTAHGGYDLVVVGGQTWFGGLSAPVEALLDDPGTAEVLRGRDVAIVTVCRGVWRRTQAMTYAGVARCGGRVVGARVAQHPGREPLRILSFLWHVLSGRRAEGSGFPTPQHLDAATLADLRAFGEDLAVRAGSAP